MKPQVKHIETKTESYFLLLDEYFNIIETSENFGELFSFLNTENGVLIPVSESFTDKLHFVLHQWLNKKPCEDFNLINKHQKVLNLRCSVQELKGGNGNSHYLIQLRDSENENPLKKKIRDLKKELEGFVYRASHDLRAPLLSVLGCLQLMRMDKVNFENYIDHIEDIVKNLDHNLKEISRQVFDRGARISVSTIDLKSLLDDTLSNFITNKNYVKTQLETHIEQSDELMTDHTLLKMILTNVLSNAFNFAKRESKRHQIKVTLSADRNKLICRISDTGQGIAEHLEGKIYEMFYRASNASQGIGLGLYMTKSAIDDLGGAISYTSSKKRTEFTIEIPNLHTEEQFPILYHQLNN